MKSDLKVAVVGGGIGGLTAANALVSRGIDVAVYERAPQLGEVGAGLVLTPNSVRVFEELGLDTAIVEVGARVGAGSSYNRHDGTSVTPVVTSDAHGSSATYGLHRADLLSVLASSLPEGVVHTGHEVSRVEQDAESATLHFADGNSTTASVVVGADGIQSKVQHFVVGPTASPIYSGTIAYRGLVDSEGLEIRNDIVAVWMGEGRHFMTYPVRSGRMLNYVGFVSRDASAEESWSAPGDPDELRAYFEGWDPRVEQLLSKVEKTYWWGIYDREPLAKWTQGRVTLLGDAAHPMHPHMGQGANQSVEDAITLALLLEESETLGVEAALQRYESIRRPHTAEVQAGSRAQGKRTDSHFDDLDQRDADLKASAEFRRSIFSHDAVAVARAALEDLIPR